MFEQGLGRQYEYSKWQGHSKQREHQRGKEEHGAKTGLGDIRLGYKCCLSPFSAGLPTASCCSHLFSCFAIPCTPKPAITSPFPLLHLLTSCPKHMGTEMSERASCKSVGGEVYCRSGREGEGHRNDMTGGLETPWLLSFTWKPFLLFHGQHHVLPKWFWLIASLVLIQRKYIKSSSSLNERGKKNHRLFTKENVWKKDLEQSSNQDLNS